MKNLKALRGKADVVSFNTCLNACENGRVSDAALSLLHRMELQHVSPNIVSMNTVISCCEKTSAWQNALCLVETLPNHVLVPDLITYNASISACGTGYKWQQALSLFDIMQCSVKASNSSLSPDEISFAALISACSNASQLDSALKLLNKMQRSVQRPNLVIYNSCLHACEKFGNWKRALHLLEFVLKARQQADLLSYTSIIRACHRAGYTFAENPWQQICYLLEQMSVERVLLDSFCLDAAIGSVTRASQVSLARQLLGSFPQNMLKQWKRDDDGPNASNRVWHRGMLMTTSWQYFCLHPRKNVDTRQHRISDTRTIQHKFKNQFPKLGVAQIFGFHLCLGTFGNIPSLDEGPSDGWPSLSLTIFHFLVPGFEQMFDEVTTSFPMCQWLCTRAWIEK